LHFRDKPPGRLPQLLTQIIGDGRQAWSHQPMRGMRMAITGLGQGGLVMLAGLILVNLALWGLALLLFGHSPVLLGTAFLAYGFGLRHAVDADHIAAIDNVTRKLMRPERRPVGVGLWFSLGHSSVVFVLAAAVAASAGAVQAQFGALAHFGGVAGTLVSAGFLFGLAAMNLLVLISVIATFRQVKAGGSYREDELDLLLARRGIFSRVFRALCGLVRRDRHM
jgi:high-affinity nickel-transport protein